MDLSPGQFSPAMMPKRKPQAAPQPVPDGFTLHPHAARQATAKGWSHEDVLEAANNPQTTYDNGRFPGQKRHIRGDLVAVVETASKQVRTVYQNVTETDLRPDQTDRDAQRYGRSRKS